MHRVVVCLFVASLAAGCDKGGKPPPPSSGAPDMQTESGPKSDKIHPMAQAIFQEKCAMCHGLEGRGDGPGARELPIKPRNYTDPAWQASVTDDEIKKIILLGGQPVGKSAQMPGNPDLKQQPEVLDGLVKIIRRFGKKK